MYNTKGLQAVISFLSEHRNTPFSVREMSYEMSAYPNTDMKPSETTLYRILNKLAKDKIVQKIISSNREYQYIMRTDEPQLNVRCGVCGKVFETDDDLYRTIVESVTEKGMIGSILKADIVGICEKCK